MSTSARPPRKPRNERLAQRRARTAAARAALHAKFVREVDPDGVLDPDELRERVREAKAAYFRSLGARGIRTMQARAERRRAEYEAS
jgi:hypothetical protein